MRLYSPALEVAAVRTICDVRDEMVQAKVLSSLSSHHFNYEPAKAAFDRVTSVAKKRAVILGFDELLADPALNEEYRELLADAESKLVKTSAKAERLVESLEKYRKARLIYEQAKSSIETLKQSEVDVDALLDKLTSAITEARTNKLEEDLVYTVGDGGNAENLAEIAMEEEAADLLKTGFTEYDTKNGGLPGNGVMVLAATTSGGKSTMLQQLLLNLYKLNKISVCDVSLEMDEKKLTRRLLSNLTRIPYWKFVKKQLEPKERDFALKKWKQFHAFGEKNGCKFSMICPTRSVTIEQVLTLAKPYKYKVIGIDYVSLLEGVDAADQWKVLSAIVRICKIFSREEDCLVVILAQLDSDDDRIRYSKGMLEHADVCWTWNYYKAEQRETKTLPIKQLKARDQELFPFDLREEFEFMTIKNMEDDSSEDKPTTTKGKKLDTTDEVEVDYESGQR